jgi:hypothetical protein
VRETTTTAVWVRGGYMRPGLGERQHKKKLKKKRKKKRKMKKKKKKKKKRKKNGPTHTEALRVP